VSAACASSMKSQDDQGTRAPASRYVNEDLYGILTAAGAKASGSGVISVSKVQCDFKMVAMRALDAKNCSVHDDNGNARLDLVSASKGNVDLASWFVKTLKASGLNPVGEDEALSFPVKRLTCMKQDGAYSCEAIVSLPMNP